ncbi:MAG: MBL fold metallo-hydrolase [Pseudomonadales bacterium]
MRLRWLIVLVVAAATALLVTYRAEVAMWAMSRALDANMTGDAIAELPDGLHLAVCGAGAPLPAAERSGPCLAVIAGRRLFLVDSGSNGIRNLQRMGLPAGRIEAVLLTHFHSDHIDGLGETSMLRWTAGSNSEPLPVYGPTGVERVVAGFNEAYALDATYRTAHHGALVAPPGGAGSRAMPFALPGAGAPISLIDDGDLHIRAFVVDHEPVVPAVGYRFDYGGRSLVISGDTKESAEVERLARDVDLLAHEALAAQLVGLMNRAARDAGRDNLAHITQDILDYHTTPEEAAAVAERAGARHLLLYHIVPPLPLPGLATAFLEGVGDRYPGPVTLSVDGTFVTLPAGSGAIEVSQRL